MHSRYLWLRRFLAVFCVTLIVALAGVACAIADVNTRSTAFSVDPTVRMEVEAGTASLPEWAQRAMGLLPAPARLLGWLPEGVGITLPREQDRQRQLPRLPEVAKRQQAE